MKKLLFLIALISCISCTSPHKQTVKTANVCQAESGKKLPKAACVLRIDRNEVKYVSEGQKFRNVKAKVYIDKDGKIRVLEYEKEQHILVTNKIERLLKKHFRVKPEYFEKRYCKVGEQIIFFRFLDKY